MNNSENRNRKIFQLHELRYRTNSATRKKARPEGWHGRISCVYGACADGGEREAARGGGGTDAANVTVSAGRRAQTGLRPRGWGWGRRRGGGSPWRYGVGSRRMRVLSLRLSGCNCQLFGPRTPSGWREPSWLVYAFFFF